MNHVQPHVKEARALRRAFLHKFTNKTLPQYRCIMGHQGFYGNYSAHGHIWEILSPRKVITLETALKHLADFPELYVTWDNNCRVKNRSAEKNMIIKLSGGELVRMLLSDQADLPFPSRDICIFDTDLSFYIAVTSRYAENVGVLCLTSIEMPDTAISPMLSGLLDI